MIPGPAAQRLNSDAAGVADKQAKKRGGEDEIPQSEHHYRVPLIKEMGKVMRHIHSNPPRKYSFEE